MGACTCAICQHTPSTLRRLRCQRHHAAAEPDLHTPAHVDWTVKLLPSEQPQVVEEDDDQPAELFAVRRLGNELPWLALFALLTLFVAGFVLAPTVPPAPTCTNCRARG